MLIPEKMTESEVLQIIENVVNMVAPTIKIKSMELDDIKQEARYEAIKLLDSGKYDGERPLSNFMYIHLRNRLYNLDRNLYKKNDPPCPACHYHASSGCLDGGNQEPCEKYQKWQDKTKLKKNVVNPVPIDKSPEPLFGGDFIEEIQRTELMEYIDGKLDMNLRGTYLKMLDGVVVTKNKKYKVQSAVKSILQDYLWEKSQDVVS